LYTALINAGLFRDEHPIRGIAKLKEAHPATTYLLQTEISSLLDALNGDNKRIAILCLSTGARWSEAAGLRREQITHNRVTYLKTKTHRVRSVPISGDVASAILQRETGLLFSEKDYVLFRTILREVKPDLPKGQATHVMRHTFATHFMINGGNIITLQRILGHQDISQTMR